MTIAVPRMKAPRNVICAAALTPFSLSEHGRDTNTRSRARDHARSLAVHGQDWLPAPFAACHRVAPEKKEMPHQPLGGTIERSGTSASTWPATKPRSWQWS